LPILEGPTSALGLYNDDRFPGRCLLALRDHFDHFDEVPASLQAHLFNDAARVGHVLRSLGLATRVNYAVLGNVHSHVHVHIIPRGGPKDLITGRPPWEHPLHVEPLADSEVALLSEKIRTGLDRL
jgi:diadenosine tetraphosphate (Ap4A) HIT family hydrolase